MKILGALSRHAGHDTSERAVVWQSAAFLLAYPDEESVARMALVRAAAAALPDDLRTPLQTVALHILDRPLIEAQQEYVQTFDWKRRRALFLSYWTTGDTRNRGQAIVRFAQTYRAAGVAPPSDELADHLAVVLEFAATVDGDSGYDLLAEHRTPLAMLRDALSEARSPYALVVGVVCSTLPEPGPDDLAAARRLAATGPPVEAVGLE
ncbi:MAG: nitrate reductase molybdenum cofactor assembly chaperone, partial [Acidimicrobiales bacterium]